MSSSTFLVVYLEIVIKDLAVDLYLKMDREAVLLVHPIRAEQRNFVGTDFEDVIDSIVDDRQVYALTQNGYDDELVGHSFYDEYFEDRGGRGNLTSEVVDQLSDFEGVCLGGGKASECVLKAARSLGYRGWEPGEIVVGAEITYEPVDNSLVTVEDIIEEETIDESEYLGSLYYLAEVDSVL